MPQHDIKFCCSIPHVVTKHSITKVVNHSKKFCCNTPHVGREDRGKRYRKGIEVGDKEKDGTADLGCGLVCMQDVISNDAESDVDVE